MILSIKNKIAHSRNLIKITVISKLAVSLLFEEKQLSGSL